MEQNLLFLPAPRRIAYQPGQYALLENRLILLDSAAAVDVQTLLPAAQRFQAALKKHAGLSWSINASPAVPSDLVSLTLRIAPHRAPEVQGYRLHIGPEGMVIEGHDPAGVFYGVCTLIQVLEQSSKALPCLEVQDAPDIAARGVMLDISRDKVYRMETLYELVDRLAGWKINQLQLYTEHTFAYLNHPEVWEHASPMTGEEIMALDAYCRERFIELVPNQNSFGHMHRWLTFPRYAPLAETHGKIYPKWGGVMQGPFSLAPENPGSLELVTSLFDELLPHFSSRMFNVGCDETVDLGQGVSREICEQRGTGRVYLDFLMKIYEDVKRRGFTMQFWGDIINDYPELVPELPRDVIALDWGYDADHPFDVETERFAASGVPFYVCPGTSTWITLAGRTDNALKNLLSAAENGVKNGAIGYLNTDWGDRGHWQVPAVSLLGFAAGAGLSWSVDANRDNPWAEVVSRFGFEDPTGAMGQVAYHLGNVYQTVGVLIPNASALYWILAYDMDQLASKLPGYDTEVLREGLTRSLEEIDRCIAPMAEARMARPDAALIKREYLNTARLMRHACRRGLMALNGSSGGEREAMAADMREFLAEYRELWLARNRPGGLKDSAARFEQLIEEYCA